MFFCRKIPRPEDATFYNQAEETPSIPLEAKAQGNLTGQTESYQAGGMKQS